MRIQPAYLLVALTPLLQTSCLLPEIEWSEEVSADGRDGEGDRIFIDALEPETSAPPTSGDAPPSEESRSSVGSDSLSGREPAGSDAGASNEGPPPLMLDSNATTAPKSSWDHDGEEPEAPGGEQEREAERKAERKREQEARQLEREREQERRQLERERDRE